MVASVSPVEGDPRVFDVVRRPTSDGPLVLRTRHDLDLDLATLAAARAELAALLADRGTPLSVVVHLGPRYFVDMRGMRLVVDVAREVREHGGDLTVVAAPRRLRSMVARLDLGDELPLAGRIGG